jgi:hypothetical protein
MQSRLFGLKNEGITGRNRSMRNFIIYTPKGTVRVNQDNVIRETLGRDEKDIQNIVT